MPESSARSPFDRFFNAVDNMIDGPVTWFRGLLFSLIRLSFVFLPRFL
jgi:hypothetical protein